ncbi:hypothetical protein ACLXAX_14805 [Escherichia coli]
MARNRPPANDLSVFVNSVLLLAFFCSFFEPVALLFARCFVLFPVALAFALTSFFFHIEMLSGGVKAEVMLLAIFFYGDPGFFS